MVPDSSANWTSVIGVFIALLAVGMVASTIGSVVVYDVGGESDWEQPPPDDSLFPDPAPPDDDPRDNGDGSGPSIDLVYCLEMLTQPASVFGIIAGMVGILYLTYLRFNLATALLAGSFLVPFVMLGYFFLTNCPPGSGRDGPGLPPGSDLMERSDALIDGVPMVPPAVAGVFGVGVVLLAVVMLVSMTRRAEQRVPVSEESTDDPDTAAFARAAGRAAERIQEANVPVDNAVYQAWLEMTGLLALDNPESTAPREFADSAIAVGLAAEDVHELTDLFTEVRYGQRDPASREERALAVLRSIETTYQAEAATDDQTGQ